MLQNNRTVCPKTEYLYWYPLNVLYMVIICDVIVKGVVLNVCEEMFRHVIREAVIIYVIFLNAQNMNFFPPHQHILKKS